MHLVYIRIRIIQTRCIISKVMNDCLKVQCSGTLFKTGTTVGGRYPTTSSHFSAQQDMLPAKNMIATQARQNKRRHAFQRCPWEAYNRKGKKTHVHSDSFRNTHMPSIGGTLSLKCELVCFPIFQYWCIETIARIVCEKPQDATDQLTNFMLVTEPFI
jgi:hypothetical protein